MHEIEYLFYLATEATDRLRVTARKDKALCANIDETPSL